jgi:hypothetical protein
MVDPQQQVAEAENQVATVNVQEVMLETAANNSQVQMTTNHAIPLASQQAVIDNLHYKIQVAITRLNLKDNKTEEEDIKKFILNISKRLAQSRTEFSQVELSLKILATASSELLRHYTNFFEGKVQLTWNEFLTKVPKDSLRNTL